MTVTLRLRAAVPLAVLLLGAVGSQAVAQRRRARATCDFSTVPGVVWWGQETRLTVSRIAAYLGPILWFSPDEPLLHRASGADIRMPEALPFEPAAERPVVYYQLDRVVTRVGATAAPFARDSAHPGNTIVDLEQAQVLTMSFFTHYPEEVGLGAHEHDVEPAEFRIVILPHDSPYLRPYIPGTCAQRHYILAVTRTTAKAHAFVWFWSILQTDEYSEFPITLLVEEGKHALATDKNGDGVFTPGYDVNRRINDAWGTRDIIRTGMLFSGGYESWMAKVRRPEHRVFPPLPDDSPLRANLARRAGDAPHAVYELRPFPSARLAAGDAQLHHLMEMQGAVEGWPTITSPQDLKEVLDIVGEGEALRSLSIAFRADGDNGFSFVFPFFIVKHLEDPMTGGFIVQRMYLKDERLRDFGWMALYTRSASRWLDPYLAAGVEWDTEVDTAGTRTKRADFVFETGLKFRANLGMARGPAHVLSLLTDYWGVRLGIANRGFWDVNRIRYVFEIGAGSF